MELTNLTSSSFRSLWKLPVLYRKSGMGTESSAVSRATSFVLVAILLSLGLTFVDGLSCNSDWQCSPDLALDRCCAGQCVAYEYCQKYHPDEWAKKEIYNDHYTLLCDHDYQCATHADAKIYVSENEVECCDGECQAEKECETSGFLVVVVIIVGCCCFLICTAGIVGAVYHLVCKPNTPNYRGGGMGMYAPHPPMHNQPSPPSYAAAPAPVISPYFGHGPAYNGGFSGHGDFFGGDAGGGSSGGDGGDGGGGGGE